ncbi:NAD(P)/FAD-dependent oxidoreductase [Saccharicrinis sp. FJH2]|uniref:NAD(P)/FAD-dependent oxidoreductase n=1 Tax=Saccharicrinis sp. FJH65 TaxID=3344659 RepID=UPI0035F2D6E7
MKKKVIIIGAGTVGLHCAFFLSQAGFEVEVIDDRAKDDYSNCSFGNCGYITPSHFVPLASPSMLQAGLKMLFDPTGPVYFPLSKNIKKLPWFMKFVRSANSKQVREVAPTLYKLNEQSRKLYELLTLKYEAQSDLVENGLLMASVSEEGFKEEIELTEMAGLLGIETKIYRSGELKEIEPDLEFNIAGAVLYKSDAHIHPQKHMIWLRNRLIEDGVGIRDGIQIDRILTSKGRIESILAKDKVFRADEYVIAAGAKSSDLAKMAGIRLPVIAGKGYSTDFVDSAVKLHTPVILTEARVALTPLKDGLRLGSGMEFSGETGHVRLRRVQAMLDRTHHAIPSIPSAEAEKLNIWEGLRPLSPDGVPFIGRTQKLHNLLFATGHAMMGMSLGPVTGQIISDVIAGNKTDFNMNQLHPDRFS